MGLIISIYGHTVNVTGEILVLNKIFPFSFGAKILALCLAQTLFSQLIQLNARKIQCNAMLGKSLLYVVTILVYHQSFTSHIYSAPPPLPLIHFSYFGGLLGALMKIGKIFGMDYFLIGILQKQLGLV